MLALWGREEAHLSLQGATAHQGVVGILQVCAPCVPAAAAQATTSIASPFYSSCLTSAGVKNLD